MSFTNNPKITLLVIALSGIWSGAATAQSTAGTSTGGTPSGAAQPRPALIVEQPRVSGSQSLTSSAEKGVSPGINRYGLQTPQYADSLAAMELQSLQEKATVLSELPRSLTLYVGQMILIKSTALGRIAIGNGKVLGARVVDNENLLLTGTDGGDTTLHVWSKSGVLKKIKVRVNAFDNERTIEELRDMTAGIAGVAIRRVGEKVVIDGSNLDPGAVSRLDALSKLYPQVVNLATADRIRLDRMVEIQVRIMEFNKSALDDLGVKWQNSSDGFNFGLFSDIASSGTYRILPEGSTFAEGNVGVFPGNINRRTPEAYFGLAASLSSRINLLVQRGNAFLLASPNLSTRSGGEAKFLAGGEIPLPAISALGGGSVDFKAYGVLLNIKPIADGDGNIAGNILTEVSSIDRSVAVQGIPGLLIRRTDTEFNVRDGETIVLSGLISRESSRSNDGLPGLRKIPVLGNIFKSNIDNDRESEVIVFITPRVVNASSGRLKIERAQEQEQSLTRNFGTLTEDRTVQKPASSVPAVSDFGGRLHPDDGP